MKPKNTTRTSTTGRTYRSVADLMRGKGITKHIQKKVKELKAKSFVTEISIPGSDALTKLTPKEQAATEAFLEAAQKLPKSLRVSLNDYAAPNESHLAVYKRVTRGFSVFVGGIRKRSLIFP